MLYSPPRPLCGLLLLCTSGLAQAPTIDVWEGLHQGFGARGNPQKWVNVLGTVSDADGIGSLTYRLNGSEALSLNIGPDLRRLFKPGDFNIELDHETLSPGENSLSLTASDTLGNESTIVVTVDYQPNRVWNFGTTNWADATRPSDVAQICDGEWASTSAGVRPTNLAYDRTFVIGRHLPLSVSRHPSPF